MNFAQGPDKIPDQDALFEQCETCPVDALAKMVEGE